MRSKSNLILDLILFASGFLLAISGFSRWLMPRGKYFILNRYAWGTLHRWISIIFSTLVLIHLFSHWGWLVSMFRHNGKN